MATVPTVFTFAAGSVLTAAQLNTYLTQAVSFLINRPVCELRQTVPQSFTSGSTTTTVLFDTEDVDNDGMHSTTTNTSRATAQTPGRYRVSGGVGWQPSATGRRGCWWFLNGSANNGSETIGPASASNTTVVCARSKTLFLNVGDYVELLGYQESGTLSTSGTTFEQSSMSVLWIGTT